MSDENIVALLGLIVTVIAIMTPVLKLSSNIVKLNANIEHMMKNDEIRDKRIDSHGHQIESIIEKQRMNEKVLDLHELRIGRLEDKSSL